MTAELTALRSNELFGGVDVSRRIEPHIQLTIFDSSFIADSPEQQSSKRAATISATPNHDSSIQV
jgi:hypothetical protein